MKPTAFILLLFFIPLLLGAQPKKTLYDKARELKRDGRYEQAIRIFKKSFDREPEDRAWVLNAIGDIEIIRGNFHEAQLKYSSILTEFKDDNYYLQYIVHLKLADIYINRKDFEGALRYLRSSEDYKNMHGCGTGKYEQEYELCYKYALCYDGLNQVDSALNKLTRFMFKDCPLLTRQKQHVERNRFYYQLLLKKYDPCVLQGEMLNAINNLNYFRRPDTSWTGISKMQRITCSLNFFGETIVLGDFGATHPEDFYPYTKQGFLDRVYKSELCRLISGGGELN